MIKTALGLSYTGQHLLHRWEEAKRVMSSSEKYKLMFRCAAFWAFDLLLGVVALMFISTTCRGQSEALSALAASKNPSVGTVVLGLAEHYVVPELRRLLIWVMGAPAGLKLNSVLSAALGKFFLYHIHLWRTFLRMAAPYISIAVHWTFSTGLLHLLGLQVQICLLQDALNLMTFHIHCFYAYARRLFISQTSGLTSLWRLFRGKKWNPLRNRVDSMPHTVEQLFVGTVGFTVLLFLYPTTLVFYVIFGSLEGCTRALHWLLGSVVDTLSLLSHRGFMLKPPTIDHMSCWAAADHRLKT